MTFAFACIFFHKATRLLAFGPFSFSMGLVFFKFSHGRSLFDEHAKRPSLANLMAGLEPTKILSAVKRARGDDFGDANWNTKKLGGFLCSRWDVYCVFRIPLQHPAADLEATQILPHMPVDIAPEHRLRPAFLGFPPNKCYILR